jgi:hypothetical protein
MGNRIPKETRMFAKVVASLNRLHRDEQGAEGLEKLLIVAAILLPILGLLIFFAGDIMAWVRGIFGTAKENSPDINKTLKGDV